MAEKLIIKNDDFADLNKQHEFIDNLRSTNGIDYDSIQKQAEKLVDLRIKLENEGKLSQYDAIGNKLYPDFSRKFPNFFKSIKNVEKNRLDESKEIMYMILHNLSKVKNGEMTHTQMRNHVFENNLASRFVKKK